MTTDDRRPGSINFVAPYKGGRIDGWPTGVDNRSSDPDVPRSSLRDAVNVDILTSGKPRMRRGMRQVIADANAHSGFAHGDRMVWATPTTLNVSGANLVKRVILTDARLAKPLSYTVINEEIYFSNEDICGKITVAGDYVPWGITSPAAAPTLSATAGTRVVQVTCTFVLATGEESGAPLGVAVLCGDSPTIQVTNIPQSSDARVVATRLYFTELDGSVFFAQDDVAAGVTTYTFRGYAGRGQILETQFMDPLPPGQLIDSQNGILYVASGSTVFHSEPLRYGLYAPGEAHYAFSTRVTLLRAVSGGLYISADQTYFISKAGTDDADQNPTLPYCAYEGATCDAVEGKDVFWMSERGLVRADQEGKMANLTEMQIAVDVHSRGCLGVITTNGHRGLVAIMKDVIAPTPLASRDYLAVRDL